MKKKLIKIINKIRVIVNQIWSLSDNGERVDLIYNNSIDFSKLDIYQKSHYERYEFVKKIIKQGDICGDFACGTGYGSVMLSEKASLVIGGDINKRVVNKIKKRYSKIDNVSFVQTDLLRMDYNNKFDKIISFETIEHFKENDISSLFSIFYKALKVGGQLIFSVPYKQEKSENAIKMGFHLTFNINENSIEKWLKENNFSLSYFKYQNYEDHIIKDELVDKDFIICVAIKNVKS